MPLIDGDLVRTVQHATILDTQGVSSKFYHRVVADDVISNSQVTDAVENWLEAAYFELRNVITADCELKDAVIDRIAYESGAWRTKENVGIASPVQPFLPASPPPPAQVAALLTFSTANPKVRRPFYQWGVRLDGIIAGKLFWTIILAFVNFGVVLLYPPAIDANNYLLPVTVSARNPSSHHINTFTVTDWTTAMSRRRSV